MLSAWLQTPMAPGCGRLRSVTSNRLLAVERHLEPVVGGDHPQRMPFVGVHRRLLVRRAGCACPSPCGRAAPNCRAHWPARRSSRWRSAPGTSGRATRARVPLSGLKRRVASMSRADRLLVRCRAGSAGRSGSSAISASAQPSGPSGSATACQSGGRPMPVMPWVQPTRPSGGGQRHDELGGGRRGEQEHGQGEEEAHARY